MKRSCRRRICVRYVFLVATCGNIGTDFENDSSLGWGMCGASRHDTGCVYCAAKKGRTSVVWDVIRMK